MAMTHTNGQSHTPTRTARAPPTEADHEAARPLRVVLPDGSDDETIEADEQGDCEPPDAAGYETEKSEKSGLFLSEFIDVFQPIYWRAL